MCTAFDLHDVPSLSPICPGGVAHCLGCHRQHVSAGARAHHAAARTLTGTDVYGKLTARQTAANTGVLEGPAFGVLASTTTTL